MRAGKILNQGTPEEIVTPPVLREIYDFDIAVHQIEGQRLALYYL